jgi:hypothetical protein
MQVFFEGDLSQGACVFGDHCDVPVESSHKSCATRCNVALHIAPSKRIVYQSTPLREMVSEPAQASIWHIVNEGQVSLEHPTPTLHFRAYCGLSMSL